jgi:hypothetical protein
MKMVNEGIDKVRREEVVLNHSLKKTRYIWLKNPDNYRNAKIYIR